MAPRYNFPVYATQGGGLARYVQGTLIWVVPPKDFPCMQVGDEVPQEWGTVLATGIGTDEEEEEEEDLR